MTGMATGWAWGSAAMAAGLRARSTVLLASQLQRVDARSVPFQSTLLIETDSLGGYG